MYALYIANKNYSSWSLRPWVLLRELQIPFREHGLLFGDNLSWKSYLKLAPNGKVPCLVDGENIIWDSLSIVEYIAEQHPRVWPGDRAARAWARSASAEMHSGFGELRNRCSMSCGVKVRLNEFPAALQRDVARVCALWNDGLRRFGGPFLAGPAFTAVDAFFAPVAFRAHTYGLELDEGAARYRTRLLELTSMRDWYAAAVSETARDLPHEAEIMELGTILEDVRAS